MDAKFLISAAKASQLPEGSHPEIIVVGRSNCGKSSLINALCNRKDLARTSSTPGRTQLANFFTLNDKLTIVDLPGYGFSATGKSTRSDWQELAIACLERPQLKFSLFLMDIRRKLTDEDRELAKFLSSHSPVLLILTKTDKLSKIQIQKSKQFIESDLVSSGIDLQQCFAVSSLKKTGIDILRDLVLDNPSE